MRKKGHSCTSEIFTRWPSLTPDGKGVLATNGVHTIMRTQLYVTQIMSPSENSLERFSGLYRVTRVTRELTRTGIRELG